MSHLQPFTIKELRTPQEIRRSIRQDYDPVEQGLRADTYRNLARANAGHRIEPGEQRHGIRNNGDSAIFVGVG